MVPAIEGKRITVEKYDVFGDFLDRLFMLINVVQVIYLRNTVFVPTNAFFRQLLIIFMKIINLKPAMHIFKLTPFSDSSPGDNSSAVVFGDVNVTMQELSSSKMS